MINQRVTRPPPRSTQSSNTKSNPQAKPKSDENKALKNLGQQQHENLPPSGQQSSSQIKRNRRRTRPTKPTKVSPDNQSIHSQSGPNDKNKAVSAVQQQRGTDSESGSHDDSRQSRIIYLTNRVQYELKAELLVNAVPFRMPGSRA